VFLFYNNNGGITMQFRLYNKYRIRTLKKGLDKTEEKIEQLMNPITNGTKARRTIEKDLIKQYNAYTLYAREYVQRQLKKVDSQEFVENRLSYKGWQLIVGLLDEIYIKLTPSKKG
jgi:predicted ATP-dependent Lon-type protease